MGRTLGTDNYGSYDLGDSAEVDNATVEQAVSGAEFEIGHVDELI
jgi:hypothetical protein